MFPIHANICYKEGSAVKPEEMLHLLALYLIITEPDGMSFAKNAVTY